jgi:DNA-binding response OmpR family regulator
VRELLSEIMEAEGYAVVLAENGEQALREFAKRNFKAVFTDVGMPGMSGWELARAIRERNATVPLAVITGWGEAVGSDEQAHAQVDWVISKPFAVDRICEIAVQIAERSGCGVSTSPAVATGT